MVTDSQCWHCGKGLSPNKAAGGKQPQPVTAVPDDTLPPLPLRTILLYASLTTVTLLILIATTIAIGQAPLFLVSGSTTPLAGWQPITDSQLQFTLNLPEAWQTIELDRSPEAPNLRSSPPLQALGSTFSTLVADTQLLFLGTEDTAVFPSGAPVFVLVAQSQRLQRLSPDELITYAVQQLPESVSLVEATTIEGDNNTLKSNLLFNIQQGEQIWRCQEQFIPGNNRLYLVATCTSFAQFPRHQSDFEAILRSFQPLGS